MRDAGAEAGELCGWCREAINEGAFACGRCGAVRHQQVTGFAGCFVPVAVGLGILVLMIAGPLLVLEGARQVASIGIVAGIALTGLGVLMWFKGRRKVVWTKGQT